MRIEGARRRPGWFDHRPSALADVILSRDRFVSAVTAQLGQRVATSRRRRIFDLFRSGLSIPVNRERRTVMTMDRVDAYLEAHRGDFEEQLKALIRIPSISAQPDHDADTRRAATFIRDDLAAMGLEAELIETKRHPIVYAEWLGAPGKPTLLIYGHYDVQPPEPLEPWLSPPFEPTVRDGNLYARGATDDKGQMFTHLKAAEAWLKTAGKLPVNVKFVIEGEEEVGGASLEAYVAENTQTAGLRLRRHLRHQPVRPRSARDHLRPERAGLLRAARSGSQPRPALGDLRRRRRQPAQRAGDDPRQPEGARRQDPDRRLLRRVKPLEDWERAEFAKLPFSEAEFQADLGVSVAGGRGRLHHARAEVGPADLRRQRHLRRLRRPRAQDRAALQGRRQAQLPPGPRPGPQDGRAAVPGPRRQGLPAGRDLRDHQPPRRAGRPGQYRYPRRPRRGPRRSRPASAPSPSSSARGARSRSSG